jgi:hypothetical protein
MNDKDKKEFEKWLYENKSSLVIHGGLKKMIDDFHLCWSAACDYIRNRSPLDPVSLYDKLEQERERSEILVEALEKISKIRRKDGNDNEYEGQEVWVAQKALKLYRGEI